MASPTVRVNVSAARGESFADVARRVGEFGGLPVPDDATDGEVLDLIYDGLVDVVEAAQYTVIAAVDTATATDHGDVVLSGEQTLGGYLTNASRVLLTDQTDPEENGIWVSASGAWTRATDFDGGSEVVNGSYVPVLYGANAGAFVLVTPDPINVGTTHLDWRQIDYRYADKIPWWREGAAAATNLSDKLRQNYHLFDFITLKSQQDAIRAGEDTDDHQEFLQDASYTVSDEGGGRLQLPSGILNSRSKFWMRSGVIIEGVGEQTIFNIDNDHEFIGFGEAECINVGLRNFKVVCDSASPGATADAGLIVRDYSGSGDFNTCLIEGLIFETENNCRDHVLFVARPNSPTHNITHRNNLHRKSGRMGFEIIQHTDYSTDNIDNLVVELNHFAEVGLIDTPIQLSLSGGMNKPRVLNNTFIGSDATGYGLELARPILEPLIQGNHFEGTFAYLVSNSTVAGNAMKRGQFTNNTTAPATTGRLIFSAWQDGFITENDISVTSYAVELGTNSSNVFVQYNRRLETSGAVAVIMDNTGGHHVVNNRRISTSASGANQAVVLNYNAGATGNYVQNNVLVKGTGGSYVLDSSAGTNFVGGNRHGTVQLPPPGYLTFTTGSVSSGSLALGAKSSEATFTATGVALGDVKAGMGFSIDLAGMEIHWRISAANTITYYFENKNGADPLSKTGTITFDVRDVA